MLAIWLTVMLKSNAAIIKSHICGFLSMSSQNVLQRVSIIQKVFLVSSFPFSVVLDVRVDPTAPLQSKTVLGLQQNSSHKGEVEYLKTIFSAPLQTECNRETGGLIKCLTVNVQMAKITFEQFHSVKSTISITLNQCDWSVTTII